MKRKDLNLKLRRLYGIRSCMLEGKYITLEEFMDEVIQVAEEFMEPKEVRLQMDTPDGALPFTVRKWEDM
jgi:hypothetical protein